MITIPGVDPLFMWVGFIALILVFLLIDLGVFNRKEHEIGIKEALIWAGVWFGAAMIFNIWIYFQFGQEPALDFFTGYLIEKSLSVDNLFVFLMIFTAFSIPRIYQHRVLFWGIIGAIIMRGLFIGLGAALLQRFEWVFYVFGAVLIYGAYRMQFNKEERFDPGKSVIVRAVRKVFPVSTRLDGHRFFTRENGKTAITVLFLTLIVIELTDVVFAFDSIPAIFAITTDPFLVFTSNIFAILGLRSLYFVLAAIAGMFEYLKTGLAIILGFIGVKLLVREFYHIPTMVSLIVIAAVLIVTMVASVVHARRKQTPIRKHSLESHVRKELMAVPSQHPVHRVVIRKHHQPKQ
jgi:tellurite resistance protein TerC